MKNFCIKREYIKEMAVGYGAAFATDRIMVDGMRVGYMYREDPDNNVDSGWRFLCGDESDEYMDRPENSGIYDVNTIANYDAEIIEHLRLPVGSIISRRNTDRKLKLE